MKSSHFDIVHDLHAIVRLDPEYRWENLWVRGEMETERDSEDMRARWRIGRSSLPEGFLDRDEFPLNSVFRDPSGDKYETRSEQDPGQDIHLHPSPKLNDNFVYLLVVRLRKFQQDFAFDITARAVSGWRDYQRKRVD